MLMQDRIQEFHLPLSGRAYDEFVSLNNCLVQVQLDEVDVDVDVDVWKCSWGMYMAAKYYCSLYAQVQTCPVFKWIWKSKCIMNIKLFA